MIRHNSVNNSLQTLFADSQFYKHFFQIESKGIKICFPSY